MKRQFCIAVISLVILQVISLQGGYAKQADTGAETFMLARRGGNGDSHDDDSGYHRRRRFFKYYRFYPHDYYYQKKIYYFPFKRYYYYYDVYPEKIYYYGQEKDRYAANPNYLSITSIANMASQGVPDDVIIEEIKRTGSVYELTSEIITYLKQNGVGDRVIDVMLETGKKY